MATIIAPSTAPYKGIRASRTSPVLVATDGRDQSDGALVAGFVMAGAPDALRVLTVVQPLPVVTPEAQLPVSADVIAARRADARRAALHQVERLLGDVAVDALVEVTEGDPARAIAAAAREANAGLIICGLGRHRVVDRVFGEETALRLIRVSSVPILAVAPAFTHAPSRIVVGVDFSETSLRAARLALELAAECATVYLVHVGPRDSAVSALNGWGPSYHQDAGDALVRMSEQLRVPRGFTAQRVLLQGDPATELMAFAASVNADLIATGSHGHGFMARLLIGSVATKLVRCSTHSVLVVPHRAAMTKSRIVVSEPVTVSVPRVEWAAALKDFTARNMVRTTTLEVDDPEYGAQAQEHDYPFLGASYDKYDECVELMLGDLSSIGRHLTRCIADADSVDIMSDEQGRDIALRIAHGAGQTLLTFTK
jgi:nucleotide-binding universal stress UspA family protein